MPDALFGPSGLLIGAMIVVAALWRDHLRADSDDRAQRDRALAGWEAQTTATRDLVTAIEVKDRADAERRRLAD